VTEAIIVAMSAAMGDDSGLKPAPARSPAGGRTN
jgi:hypothetical protein